jgi:hypothetical protein
MSTAGNIDHSVTSPHRPDTTLIIRTISITEMRSSSQATDQPSTISTTKTVILSTQTSTETSTVKSTSTVTDSTTKTSTSKTTGSTTKASTTLAVELSVLFKGKITSPLPYPQINSTTGTWSSTNKLITDIAILPLNESTVFQNIPNSTDIDIETSIPTGLPDEETEIDTKIIVKGSTGWIQVIISSVTVFGLLLGGIVWIKIYSRRGNRRLDYNNRDYFTPGVEAHEMARLENYVPDPEMAIDINPFDFRIEDIRFNSFVNEHHTLQPVRPAPEPPHLE